MPPPFTLGDHTFDDSGKAAPLSRTKRKGKRPIAGAQPPPFLAGFVREPATSEASKVLVQGTFCGHGEPTFTVFDVVIGGHERLDVVTFFESETNEDKPEDEDEDGESEGEDAAAVLVRPCGETGPWLVIYSREWKNEYGDLYPPDAPEWHTFDADEEQDVAETAQPALVSIGFEYPPDADSINEFSWIAVDAWPDGNEGDPYVLVSDETR